MTLTPSFRLRFWFALAVTALLTSCVMELRAWGQPCTTADPRGSLWPPADFTPRFHAGAPNDNGELRLAPDGCWEIRQGDSWHRYDAASWPDYLAASERQRYGWGYTTGHGHGIDSLVYTPDALWPLLYGRPVTEMERIDTWFAPGGSNCCTGGGAGWRICDLLVQCGQIPSCLASGAPVGFCGPQTEPTPEPSPPPVVTPAPLPQPTPSPAVPPPVATPPLPGNLMLSVGGETIMEFRPNGDILVRGVLTTNDRQVVQGFRDWLSSANAHARPCRTSRKVTFSPSCLNAIAQIAAGKPLGPKRIAGIRECKTAMPADGVFYVPGVQTTGTLDSCMVVTP